MAKNGQILTITAGLPFADTLASHSLSRRDDHDISETQILLPTRRGVRTLRDSFVRLNKGDALILPRLQTFGDIDEEALSLSLFSSPQSMARLSDLPPAMPSVQRQILLARLIMKVETYAQGFDIALKLAKALGQFIDQIYIEELSFKKLAEIVPDNFAKHWQITLTFLEILSQSWPAILEENNMIDAADRRSRLIHILADYWEETQPTHHIIAAGSTGSVPATSRLLGVIANLPNGQIILPGLDKNMSAEEWDSLEPSHAQYGLKTLLERLEFSRENVAELKDEQRTYSAHTQRIKMLSTILTHAAHTGAWQGFNDNENSRAEIEAAIQNIAYLPCEHMQQEALCIALILRETLETPEKTAALITPDRLLARSVTAILKRWDINIDDSAGENLIHQPIGAYLRLTLDVVINNFTPLSLLALLKHPLCMSQIDRAEKSRLIGVLETETLRGVAPKNGIDGIIERLEAIEETDTLITRLNDLTTVLSPIKDLMVGGQAPFTDMIKAHIVAAETLFNPQDGAALWAGADGQAAAEFIAELLTHAHKLGHIHPHDYRATFTELLSAVTMRPAYGTHPRLKILGQLEARLGQADLMILGGLNEGIWPADIGHDPWMSRMMRVDFGLPASERSIGLAAHDFSQAFCAPNIIITRAERADGALTIPSRWLTRLNTVLKAANIDPKILERTPYRSWAETLDKTSDIAPITRPAPTPPAADRPSGLFATKIEKWLQDPYSIYAQYILKLKPLDAIDKDIDAAERGKLLHKILEQYGQNAAQNAPSPEAIYAQLMTIAQNTIEHSDIADRLPSFWWPRFKRLATFFSETEYIRAKEHTLKKTEAKGSITVAGTSFKLSAIADRIDRARDGSYSAIDYKSGGTFTPNKIANGTLPQLPITGLILRDGGFKDIGKASIGSLSYWVLTGGRKAGTITAQTNDIDQTIAAVQENLQTLIAAL